jgi:hypothetical protein
VTCLGLAGSGPGFAAPRKAQRIAIQYAQPNNPEHKTIADQLKNARVLEYVRDILNSLRLPRRLTLKLAGCEGISNAWYGNDEIAVCYEFVDDIIKNASEGPLPIGISRLDTIIGPLLDVFLHEAGHAVFDQLKVPLFGREEDAADQFSSIIILRHDKQRARRLILGSAYQYKMDVKEPEKAMTTTAFADEHGLPAQRFFNVLCIAYGRDPKLFADVVDKGYLPKDRAERCEDEYRQVEFAFNKLIGPHIDRTLARKALKTRRKAADRF